MLKEVIPEVNVLDRWQLVGFLRSLRIRITCPDAENIDVLCTMFALAELEEEVRCMGVSSVLHSSY